MPYIKKDDLTILLKSYFMAGVTRGFGFDHEDDLVRQEEKAFMEYHLNCEQKQLETRNTTNR